MSDFEAYVKTYMERYCLARDDVLKLAVVQEVKRYYESREGGIECES